MSIIADCEQPKLGEGGIAPDKLSRFEGKSCNVETWDGMSLTGSPQYDAERDHFVLSECSVTMGERTQALSESVSLSRGQISLVWTSKEAA